MKKIALAITFFILCSAVSHADVIKFETNGWTVRKPMTWTARLLSLDSATGIITFVYIDRDQPVDLKIHVNRIYSLEFNTDDRVDRAFPSTRQQLTMPLDANPDSERLIQLVKTGVVKSRLSPNMIVDESTNFLTIYGEIKSASNNVYYISAQGKNSDQISFSLNRADLRIWVR